MAQGKITLPHICPQCGKKAETYQELEKRFGLEIWMEIQWEIKVGVENVEKISQKIKNLDD